MTAAENLPVEPGLGELIAAEIRAHMGRQRVSQRELTRRIGESHTWATRRLSGGTDRVALNTDEIDRIAGALGMASLDLLRGIYARPVTPFGLIGTSVTGGPSVG